MSAATNRTEGNAVQLVGGGGVHIPGSSGLIMKRTRDMKHEVRIAMPVAQVACGVRGSRARFAGAKRMCACVKATEPIFRASFDC